LLDELAHYEEGYGDVLCPGKLEKDISGCLNQDSSMQVPSVAGWSQIMKTSLEQFRQDILEDICQDLQKLVPCTSVRDNVVSNLEHQQHIAQNRHTTAPDTQLQFVSIPPHAFIGTSTAIANSDPTINLRIPKIIKAKKGNLDIPPAWKQAVDHWLNGDPSQNLPALKDWKPEWTKGKYREMFGEAYHQRKVVALEFLERYASYSLS
jgi:hypothetical protein